MPRRIHLERHLTDDELRKRYRAAADPVERSHWHFLWLLAGGMMAMADGLFGLLHWPDRPALQH